jgi:hypothetical protein
LLAIGVNDDVGCLNERGGLTFFASKLAPTGRVVLEEAGEQRGDGGFDPQDALAELHRLQA